MDVAPFGWLPPYDDAYITLTSAQALWTGAIPAYPGTAPLHGLTSPAHALLVALLLPLTSPLAALWWSNVVGALLFLSGIWALARAWKLSRPQAGWSVLIGATAGMVPEQLFNGLETGLAIGLVTWAMALAERRSPLAWVLVGTLPFVRPELALLSFALAVWWLRSRSESPPGVARLLTLAAVAALPWVALTAWKAGAVWPESMRAKEAFLAERCWSPELDLSIGVASLVKWLWGAGLLSLGAIGCARAGLARWVALAFGLAFTAYATLLPSHLFAYHHQRYLWGWLPVLLLGGMALLRTLPERRASLLLPAVALVGLLRAPGFLATSREWSGAVQAEERSLGDWLAQHLPREPRLMVIDAGYLAYASPYELVDVVGLKRAASVNENELFTEPTCGAGRGRALADIARVTDTAYFVSWGEWEQSLQMSAELRALGWGVELVRKRPAGAHDDWWYPVFRLTAPASRGPV